jgi:hypothetical protein
MKTQLQSTIFDACHSSARRTRLALFFIVLWLAMLASIKLSATGFNSGIIDFDFNFTGIGHPAYGPGAAAIGSAGDLWNTVSITYYNQLQPSPVDLYNTDGTSTSVEWSLLGYGGGGGGALEGTYASLFDVGVIFSSATITGLTPNQQYNLYLFSSYLSDVISVNGIDFTTPGISSGSINSLTVGSQYDVHTVTADASGTLTFEAIPPQSAISSWQIEPAPEPSTISLAGLVLLATTALQLTRSRSQKRSS